MHLVPGLQDEQASKSGLLLSQIPQHGMGCIKGSWEQLGQWLVGSHSMAHSTQLKYLIFPETNIASVL